MREEMIISILSELNAGTKDIEASAVISLDGIIIASILPPGMDEERLGALNATLVTLADRSARELGRGQLEQVLVKGSNGYILMTYTGEQAILSVMTSPNAKLGLVTMDAKKAADSVSKVV